MSGEEISIEQLQGNVVLLDFWATWCPPCVRAIPEIQKLSEEFADEGVVVIGINSDSADLNEKVEAFLDEKGITFPQVLDRHDEINRLFNVQAIPTTVLIDREGIVQSYHVGFSGADVYRQELQRVLAGEWIEKPQPPPSPMPEDVNAELITVRAHRGAPVSVWFGREVAIDGERVLVAPGDEGGLMKLNAEKEFFESVRLRDVDARRAVIAFAPIPSDAASGEGWILATESAHDYGDLEIERYDASGQQLWFVGLGVEPSSGPTYEAAVESADVNGDGDREIVVFASVTGMTSMEEHPMLMIVSDDGEILVRRALDLDGFGGLKIYPQSRGRAAKIVLIGVSQMMTVQMGL